VGLVMDYYDWDMQRLMEACAREEALCAQAATFITPSARCGDSAVAAVVRKLAFGHGASAGMGAVSADPAAAASGGREASGPVFAPAGFAAPPAPFTSDDDVTMAPAGGAGRPVRDPGKAAGAGRGGSRFPGLAGRLGAGRRACAAHTRRTPPPTAVRPMRTP
jgi:hypothetical protein